MKLSYVLFNVLLVAGGLFIYDQLKSEPARTRHEPLSADMGSPSYLPEPEEQPAEQGLQGSEGMHDLADLENRLANIERIVSRLGARPAPSADRPAVEGGGSLPSLAEDDRVLAEDPVYDERTLQTLRAYVDEIERRKREEAQRNRVGAELDRLGIELSDDQKKSVIDETLKFQNRSRELLRQGFSRDEKGREARREAFTGLQEEYKTTINRLVPTSEAEKIMNSRVARGMGFYSASTSRYRGRGADDGSSRRERRAREDD